MTMRDEYADMSDDDVKKMMESFRRLLKADGENINEYDDFQTTMMYVRIPKAYIYMLYCLSLIRKGEKDETLLNIPNLSYYIDNMPGVKANASRAVENIVATSMLDILSMIMTNSLHGAVSRYIDPKDCEQLHSIH